MTDQLLAPVSPVTWHAAISAARPGAGRAARTAPVPVRSQIPVRDQAPAAGPAAASGAAAAARPGTAGQPAAAVPDVTLPVVTIPDATGPAVAMPAAEAGAAGTRNAGKRPWTVARRPRQVAPLPCQSAPELFFAESPDDLKQAQELCRACPVRQECLAGALERGEPSGVWGGQMFLYGNIIDKKRPRGRPRRVAA